MMPFDGLSFGRKMRHAELLFYLKCEALNFSLAFYFGTYTCIVVKLDLAEWIFISLVLVYYDV